MTFYNVDKDGDYTRAPDTMQSRVETVAPGIYELRQPMMGPPYLHRIADRKPVPEKIYGDAQEMSDRIFRTYEDRRKNGLNMGVLLEGIKGSGKSLTSSLTINKIIDEGGFCVVINNPFPGDFLKNIIGTPKQPVVLDFDEFEKIYKSDGPSLSDLARRSANGDSSLRELMSKASNTNSAQESLLTFLSGGTTSGVLSMITVNDGRGINQFMQRRPSRIYYTVHYNGLPRQVIQQFAEDCLQDKTLVSEFVRKTARINDVSFDILTSLADDINRIGKGVSDSMIMMGFKEEAQDTFRQIYLYKGVDVTAFYDGANPTSSERSHYQHDLSYEAEINEYLEYRKTPDADPDKSARLRREAVPFGIRRIDDEILAGLPSLFVSKDRVFKDGTLIPGADGCYVLPVRNVCPRYDADAKDHLVVLAIDELVSPLAAFRMLDVLNLTSGEAPDTSGNGGKETAVLSEAAKQILDAASNSAAEIQYAMSAPVPVMTVGQPIPAANVAPAPVVPGDA